MCCLITPDETDGDRSSQFCNISLSPLSLYSADVQRSLSVAPYLETAQCWEHPPVNLVK